MKKRARELWHWANLIATGTVFLCIRLSIVNVTWKYRNKYILLYSFLKGA
jgi:hypothetical protein